MADDASAGGGGGGGGGGVPPGPSDSSEPVAHPTPPPSVRTTPCQVPLNVLIQEEATVASGGASASASASAGRMWTKPGRLCNVCGTTFDALTASKDPVHKMNPVPTGAPPGGPGPSPGPAAGGAGAASASGPIVHVLPADALHAPLLADHANLFRPDDQPPPLIILNGSAMAAALSEYMRNRSGARAPAGHKPSPAQEAWAVIYETTVGSTARELDHMYTRAPAPGVADDRRTIAHIAFIYSVPSAAAGASSAHPEVEVWRHHHRRGRALIQVTLDRVHQEAARNQKEWRAVMQQLNVMVTAAEALLADILAYTRLATDATAQRLRPSSLRSPSTWSCIWGQLEVQDRVDSFETIADLIILHLVAVAQRGGKYVKRADWDADRARRQGRRDGGGRGGGGGGGRGGGDTYGYDGTDWLPALPPAPASTAGSSAVNPQDSASQVGSTAGSSASAGTSASSATGGMNPWGPPWGSPYHYWGGSRSGHNNRSGGRWGGRFGRPARVASSPRDVPLPTSPMPSASTCVIPAGAGSCSLVAAPSPACAGSSSSAYAAPPACAGSSSLAYAAPPACAGSSSLAHAPPPACAGSSSLAGSPPPACAGPDAAGQGGPPPPLIGPVLPRWVRRRRQREPAWNVPPGSAVPDDDWEGVDLPGADGLADKIRAAEGRPHGITMSDSMAAIEGLARRKGVDSPLLRTAIADVRALLDASGRIHMHPTHWDIELPPVGSPVAAAAKLEELLESGAARIVMGPDARWYHRVFIVPKADGSGQRLISDLRRVNECFEATTPFHLPSPSALAGLGLVATKCDLAAAFYQPIVSEALQSRFAFVMPDGRHATYTGLPMGWAHSPRLFDLCLRPVDILLGALGVRAVRYVDDIAVVADTPEGLRRALETTVDVLSEAGWRISLKKSYLVAASTFVFLGARVDLQRASISWASAKRDKVMHSLAAIRHTRHYVPSALRSTAGRLVFLCQGVPLFRTFLRGLWDASADEGEEPLEASAALLADAEFWLSAEGMECASREWPLPHAGRATWRASTDASASGLGWADLSPPANRGLAGATGTATFPLPPRMAARASGVREVHAMHVLLQHLAAAGALREGDTIVIHTDARVAGHAAAGSARAADLVEECRALGRTILALPPIVLQTKWVPREENTRADAASRPSLAEATLTATARRSLWQWWGRQPTVDLFASPANAATSAFWTRLPMPGTAGTDGLRAPTTPGAFMYPPFALARRVALTLRDRYLPTGTPCIAVLPLHIVLQTLVHCWPAANLRPFHPQACIILPPPFTEPPVPPPLPLVAVCLR